MTTLSTRPRSSRFPAAYNNEISATRNLTAPGLKFICLDRGASSAKTTTWYEARTIIRSAGRTPRQVAATQNPKRTLEIYISRDGQQFGPYTIADLEADLNAGNIVKTDLAWYEGAPDWIPVSELPGLYKQKTPAAAARHAAQWAPSAQRNPSFPTHVADKVPGPALGHVVQHLPDHDACALEGEWRLHRE